MADRSPLQQVLSPFRRWLRTRTANAHWQSNAAVHPLGRWVARRQARQLFDLCSGFCYSQILVACDALQLFEPTRVYPVTAQSIGAEHNPALDAERIARLLDGAAALGLLERSPGGFELGPAGAALTGNPGVRAMVRHNRFLYEDLGQPLKLLAADPPVSALSRYWAYASRPGMDSDQAAISPYSELMAQSQRFVVEQILAAADFRGFRSVMDLGGGTGAFLRALGDAWPNLDLTLFDLPAVIAEARGRDSASSCGRTMNFVAGDLFGPLPPIAADLVTLVRVLHDHDEAPVCALLAELRHRMKPGSTLMIAEPLAGRRGAQGSHAYFAAYFLAMGQGQLRTRKALQTLLTDAGFELQRSPTTPVPMLVELLLARVPASGEHGPAARENTAPQL